jgi:hypothetical protein
LNSNHFSAFNRWRNCYIQCLASRPDSSKLRSIQPSNLTHTIHSKNFFLCIWSFSFNQNFFNIMKSTVGIIWGELMSVRISYLLRIHTYPPTSTPSFTHLLILLMISYVNPFIVLTKRKCKYSFYLRKQRVQEHFVLGFYCKYWSPQRTISSAHAIPLGTLFQTSFLLNKFISNLFRVRPGRVWWEKSILRSVQIGSGYQEVDRLQDGMDKRLSVGFRVLNKMLTVSFMDHLRK